MYCSCKICFQASSVWMKSENSNIHFSLFIHSNICNFSSKAIENFIYDLLTCDRWRGGELQVDPSDACCQHRQEDTIVQAKLFTCNHWFPVSTWVRTSLYCCNAYIWVKSVKQISFCTHSLFCLPDNNQWLAVLMMYLLTIVPALISL